MKRKENWLLFVLLTWIVSASGWGQGSEFYRVGSTDGEAPENLAITSDEFAQIFLEFDTQDQVTYVIEATDSLSATPAWKGVSVLTGDGQRATWLTTRRWSRTFGEGELDGGWSAQQTSDGGYIAAGGTRSFGAEGEDVYLVKTDADGDEVWSRTFGGSGNEYGYSVQQTRDGGYIVAGSTTSFGAGACDVYLIKTDADGSEVWSRTFGGGAWDQGWCVQQTSDGGYIAAGGTESFGTGAGDVYLIKTDSGGNQVWGRTFGGSQEDEAYSVQQASDGGYILAGYTNSFGAGLYDVFLIKTNASGNEVWSKTYGGTGVEAAHSVQQTSDGNYIFAGLQKTFVAGPFDDVYLVKINQYGNEMWTRTFGGDGDDNAWSVRETSDGGYIMAGWTGSFGAGENDVYLIKTDSGGNQVWGRTFGGSQSDLARSVQQTSDGGYIVAGSTTSFGEGGGDVYLIKTDRDGNAPPPQ